MAEVLNISYNGYVYGEVGETDAAKYLANAINPRSVEWFDDSEYVAQTIYKYNDKHMHSQIVDKFEQAIELASKDEVDSTSTREIVDLGDPELPLRDTDSPVDLSQIPGIKLVQT